MADQPRLRTYREVLGARVAGRDEAAIAGFRGRAYVLPNGRIVSRRQLEQQAFQALGFDYRTLEERSSRMRLEHPPGSYQAAVRFWAHKHGQTYRQAQNDDRFRGAWRQKKEGRRGAARAYTLMGIIRSKPAGGYEYTDDFLRFWMVQGGEEAA
jgi:hypothetical protein